MSAAVKWAAVVFLFVFLGVVGTAAITQEDWTPLQKLGAVSLLGFGCCAITFVLLEGDEK